MPERRVETIDTSRDCGRLFVLASIGETFPWNLFMMERGRLRALSVAGFRFR